MKPLSQLGKDLDITTFHERTRPGESQQHCHANALTSFPKHKKCNDIMAQASKQSGSGAKATVNTFWGPSKGKTDEKELPVGCGWKRCLGVKNLHSSRAVKPATFFFYEFSHDFQLELWLADVFVWENGSRIVAGWFFPLNCVVRVLCVARCPGERENGCTSVMCDVSVPTSMFCCSYTYHDSSATGIHQGSKVQ